MRSKEFVNKHDIWDELGEKLPSLKKRNYSNWIQSKLKSKLENQDSGIDPKVEKEVNKFAVWAGNRLSIKKLPKIVLSLDTEKAKSTPATGQFVLDDDKIWVYVNNRNLIDILRTVFHELVHYRQHELDMIDPGDSYPGSPIESMADMLAGKYLKIYGKNNRQIFQ